MLDHVHGNACIADAGYDTDAFISEVQQRGLKPVIPASGRRNSTRRIDKELYSIRYLVECFFHTIKRFRRIATRYEKTAACYKAFLHIACAIQWI